MNPFETYAYMANAFGGYKGHRYTNCEQAFRYAYEKGYRVFETDVQLSDDGAVICSFGWDAKKSKTIGVTPQTGVMTLERFQGLKLFGMNTVDGIGLCRLLQEFKDVFVQIDLGTLSAEKTGEMVRLLAACFSENTEGLSRLILQANSEEMLEEMKKNGSFSHYLFNVLEKRYNADELASIAKYCKKEGVEAVALKMKYTTRENTDIFHKEGISVLSFMTESKVKAKELFEAGADMVRTHYIDLYFGQKLTPDEDLEALYEKYHKEPLEQNKILISNFHGKGFGCNPKYIAQELLRRNREENLGLDIVWYNDGKESFPEGIRVVKYNSEEGIREMATARVLVDNQMKFTGFVKRKDQFFVETWHGAIPLKKIGMDNPPNIVSASYTKRMYNNFDAVDVLLSNSDFCTHMFRRSFGYAGYVLQEGMPRNDVFIGRQSDFKAEICKQLSISADKKLMLYAPTFREDKSLGAYKLDYEQLISSMGEEWVLLIRLHPHIQKLANKIRYTDRIINASVVPDMQALMAATDLLITDYSNIMFEFMPSGRPCILYASDIEEYRLERDYYFDFDKLPFPVAQDTQQVLSLLTNFDQKAYDKKVRKFSKKYRIMESGHAARQAADVIINMVKQPDYDLAKDEKLHLKWADEAQYYKEQRSQIQAEYAKKKDEAVLKKPRKPYGQGELSWKIENHVRTKMAKIKSE